MNTSDDISLGEIIKPSDQLDAALNAVNAEKEYPWLKLLPLSKQEIRLIEMFRTAGQYQKEAIQGRLIEKSNPQNYEKVSNPSRNKSPKKAKGKN